VIAVAKPKPPQASREVVRAIVQKTGELGIAILNAGAVQLPKFDRAYLTLSADHAADVAKVLGARTVIPLHFEGWAHVTQGAGELEAAFSGMGSLIACSCSSADSAPRSEESKSYGCEKHRGVPSADAINNSVSCVAPV
jgi:L-ascorbate metabolism protein UlaG (beta-lactamase superfamily)